MDDTTTRILGFLDTIGIGVELATIFEETFLPGVTIRQGGLVLDPARPYWPGDLLHEAGHIAVTAPERRPTLETVASDGGEEMAAIAWSYAAAVAIGLDIRIVFHAAGYRGGGDAIAAAFEARQYFGVPLLQWWGMTSDSAQARTAGKAFPQMRRWLR